MLRQSSSIRKNRRNHFPCLEKRGGEIRVKKNINFVDYRRGTFLASTVFHRPKIISLMFSPTTFQAPKYDEALVYSIKHSGFFLLSSTKNVFGLNIDRLRCQLFRYQSMSGFRIEKKTIQDHMTGVKNIHSGKNIYQFEKNSVPIRSRRIHKSFMKRSPACSELVVTNRRHESRDQIVTAEKRSSH